MASARFENIADDFDFLDDWEDRYRYIIDLARKMPPFPEVQKTGNFKVDGCASQVWIVPNVRGSGKAARFGFTGESDAVIVRGLIAVLHALYDNVPVQQVAEIDAVAELGRLGLDQHLSSQRSNGLRAMVVRIRAIAASLAAEGH